MKNEIKGSKMSLAALKGWETRRKRYGVKEKPSEQPDVVVEQWKIGKRKSRGYREKSIGYRNGQLMPKGNLEMRRSSVKMDDEMQAFLFGSKYIEEVVLRKMYNVAVKEAKRLIFEERMPVMAVVK